MPCWRLLLDSGRTRDIWVTCSRPYHGATHALFSGNFSELRYFPASVSSLLCLFCAATYWSVHVKTPQHNESAEGVDAHQVYAAGRHWAPKCKNCLTLITLVICSNSQWCGDCGHSQVGWLCPAARAILHSLVNSHSDDTHCFNGHFPGPPGLVSMSTSLCISVWVME